MTGCEDISNYRLARAAPIRSRFLESLLNTLYTRNRCEFVTNLDCRFGLCIIIMCTSLILFNCDERLREYKQLSFGPSSAHQVTFFRVSTKHAINTLYTRNRCEFVTNLDCRLGLCI